MFHWSTRQLGAVILALINAWPRHDAMTEQIHCSCQVLHRSCAGETDLQELEELSWRNCPQCLCNFGGAVHHNGVKKPLTTANSTSDQAIWLRHEHTRQVRQCLSGGCSPLQFWKILVIVGSCRSRCLIAKRDQLGWTEETHKKIEIYIPGKQVAVNFHQLYPLNQPQLPKKKVHYVFQVSDLSGLGEISLYWREPYNLPQHFMLFSSVTIFLQQIISTINQCFSHLAANNIR